MTQICQYCAVNAFTFSFDLTAVLCCGIDMLVRVINVSVALLLRCHSVICVEH